MNTMATNLKIAALVVAIFGIELFLVLNKGPGEYPSVYVMPE